MKLSRLRQCDTNKKDNYILVYELPAFHKKSCPDHISLFLWNIFLKLHNWVYLIIETLWNKEKQFEPAHEIMVLITMWPAKAQASLRICAVSPEPSLSTHMKYGSRQRVWPSPTGWLPMIVWRMSLRRTKNAIISWDSSFLAHLSEGSQGELIV